MQLLTHKTFKRSSNHIPYIHSKKSNKTGFPALDTIIHVMKQMLWCNIINYTCCWTVLWLIARCASCFLPHFRSVRLLFTTGCGFAPSNTSLSRWTAAANYWFTIALKEKIDSSSLISVLFPEPAVPTLQCIMGIRLIRPEKCFLFFLYKCILTFVWLYPYLWWLIHSLWLWLLLCFAHEWKSWEFVSMH